MRSGADRVTGGQGGGRGEREREETRERECKEFSESADCTTKLFMSEVGDLVWGGVLGLDLQHAVSDLLEHRGLVIVAAGGAPLPHPRGQLARWQGGGRRWRSGADGRGGGNGSV